MLTSCSDCHQVVEISSLRAHLRDECEFKARYTVCRRCDDVVLSANMAVHSSSDVCSSTARADRYCPLCHMVVGVTVGDEDWIRHLVTEGCTANPRS